LLKFIGVDFSEVNVPLFNAVAAAVTYAISLAIVIGLPWLVYRQRTTREDVGLQRLPTWSELGLAPAGLIVYFIVSGVVVWAASQLVPAFDPTQAQDVGFTQLGTRAEYIIAFMTLVVIAPVAEETLFRGYLYGKLQKYIPWWGAALITSALFGLAHGQWNVAIDTFVLGMFLATLRTVSGSLWPSILLHMLKNGMAYYFLFINTTIINTLGG
jgi:membrane protease YdiL (CAAX protease family)